MKSFDFSTYISPFTWRYGSEEMRKVFSEKHKFELWRKIWVALAQAQHTEGLVSSEELKDLKTHQNDIDIERILEIEQETHHDVVSAIREFAEKAPKGGKKIHLGATSMDVVDNADTMRIHEALGLIEQELIALLKSFSEKIEKYADTVCMAYTHLQPAEPTTLGYRFSFYAQDLLIDLKLLRYIKRELKSKGLKGAVGTAASYAKLLNEKRSQELEENVLSALGIEGFLIANQTTPRKVEYLLGIVLASIAQSLYKFAFDVRLMQSPGFGEWQEPFGKSQVGSSAMPFKKNPIKSEQICSLARLVYSYAQTALDNASHMLLERTLDDSANRRVWIPESFLALDEMLRSSTRILNGLLIYEKIIKRNLNNFAPFSATEEIILMAVKNGADRQKMHELLREISMQAWDEISAGRPNPLVELFKNLDEITAFIPKNDIESLIKPENHTGTASIRAMELVTEIKKVLTNSRKI